MSTSTLSVPRRRTQLLARAADYGELTKPRISVLVLATVAVSSFVARWGQPELVPLLHALIGTGLVAASASALNQWREWRTDQLMERTWERPVPAGRLTPREVLGFGTVLVVAGLVHLVLTTGWAPAGWAAITWVIYVGWYTPLKRVTAWNTAVGAVAGALPVLIGWSAVQGRLDVRAAALLLILFLWQFPHFMAIAWIYRRDYARAGLRMATVVDPSGRRAGVQAVLGALALLPVSFVPALSVPQPAAYLCLALLLGAAQLACAVVFLLRRDDGSARRLLRASLVYLPCLLMLLTWLPLS